MFDFHRPNRAQRFGIEARAERRRYDAWLARAAGKPEPVYYDEFAVRYAIDPDGQIAVLYYSRGSKVSPSFSIWLVPGRA